MTDLEKKQNELEEKKSKKKVVEAVDQWLAMNHQNQMYKIGGIVCLGIVCLLFVTVIFQTTKAPFVVVETEDKKMPYLATAKKFDIGEEQLERFVTEYLYLYNKWEKLDPNAIVRQIAPFSTEGLTEKLKNYLSERLNKGLKDKTVTQDIAHLKIKITEKQIIASYDKVIHINNIPLVMPTQVSLQISGGSPNRWNPMGLYVNGILEHEGSGQ